MPDNDAYTSPLAARNASAAMLSIWSPRQKFQAWRRVWLAVAEAQHACGLPVSALQLDELRAHLDVTDDDLQNAATHEQRLRHDVMAHVHALGDVCPNARPIIHLGCTSQDVVCNADLLTQHHAVRLVTAKIARVQIALADFAQRWRDTPTLGFTHYQAAQPTTVGRRAIGWCNDLGIAGRPLDAHRPRLRGFRGSTGTQAAFLELLDNDPARVARFEARAITALLAPLDAAPHENDPDASPADFIDEVTFGPVGQTYPRVHDAHTLSTLATVAAALHKIATDLRLLANRKEIDEPFASAQIGSSAMPYKRNPMRCERICGLTRFVINLAGNAHDTAATQWLERTLDDSSNRRLTIPEAFLALDGALDLMHNVADGLVVHEATIRANLMAELPFMATENLMMEAVRLGRDRQDVHEAIRRHAQEAGRLVKDEARPNDLLDRLRAEPLLEGVDIDAAMDPAQYVGLAPQQIDRYVERSIKPLRARTATILAGLAATEPRV